MVIDDKWHSWVNSVGGDDVAVGFNYIPFSLATKMMKLYVDWWVANKQNPSAADIEIASWSSDSGV